MVMCNDVTFHIGYDKIKAHVKTACNYGESVESRINCERGIPTPMYRPLPRYSLNMVLEHVLDFQILYCPCPSHRFQWMCGRYQRVLALKPSHEGQDNFNIFTISFK